MLPNVAMAPPAVRVGLRLLNISFSAPIGFLENEAWAAHVLGRSHAEALLERRPINFSFFSRRMLRGDVIAPGADIIGHLAVESHKQDRIFCLCSVRIRPSSL